MWRSLASNVLNVMIFLILLLGALAVWAKAQYYGLGPLNEAICIQVDRGSNMRSLSETLLNNKAITNASIFRIGAEYQDKSAKLKAGSFLLSENISMEEITNIVTKGGANTCGSEIVYRIGINAFQAQVRELNPKTKLFEEKLSVAMEEAIPEQFSELSKRSGIRHRVAMAEGVTSHKVVEALNKISVLSGEIRNLPAEGTLAPDSYEIQSGDDRQTIIVRMQEAQENFLRNAWDFRAKDLPLENQKQALILASIIEKETGIAAERGLISSVFLNRLNRGIPLQTDPSVIYGITRGKYILGRGLLQTELRKKTPWNTYLNQGLPPTPIANPGRASIEAAVAPTDSDYIFFVADGTGGHAFAVTLAEHNQNVAKWRALESERKNNQDN